MARIERYGNGETAMQPNDTESAKRTLRRTRNNHTGLSCCVVDLIYIYLLRKRKQEIGHSA